MARSLRSLSASSAAAPTHRSILYHRGKIQGAVIRPGAVNSAQRVTRLWTTPDRAQFQHADLTGELQDLDEQGLDRLEEAPPERRNVVVVRVLVGSNKAKRHRLISRPLQLAAGEHASGVAVDQDAQQHRRVIRCLAG